MSLANIKLFESPESDFVLVSGEGHRFPVKKSLLMAVSTVFKDILAVPQKPDAVQGEVKVTESTALLDAFLRFLHRGPNPSDLDFKTVRALFELTDKYDVPILHPALALALVRTAAQEPMDAWALLIIYDQRDAAKMCFAKMDAAPSATKDMEVWADGGFTSHRYSPTFISPELFARIPGPELQRLLALHDMITRPKYS